MILHKNGIRELKLIVNKNNLIFNLVKTLYEHGIPSLTLAIYNGDR